jgi:hypothetical protein
VTDAKGAKMKQLLHDFLSHPWVVCKEAADGADAPSIEITGKFRKGSGNYW